MDNLNIRNQVMEQLIEDGMLLDKYPQYQDDNEMVWAAITNNGNAIQYASNRIQMDEIVVKQAVDKNIEALQYCEQYKNDIDFCINYQDIKKILQYVSPKLQRDSTFLFGILRDDAEAFNDLPEEVKNNEYVILTAIEHNAKVFQYVDKKIRNNFFKMLKFIQGTNYDHEIEKSPLKYLGDRLKKDRDFALVAVSRNGYYLQFFDDKLKDDQSIVWTAIAENGNALQYASNRLRDDQETVLNAILTPDHSKYGNDSKDTNWALKYASNRIRSDVDTLSKILTNRSGRLYNANKEALDNESIISELVKIDIDILLHASERIKADAKIMIGFLNQGHEVFRYASEELRRDMDFVSLALEKTPHDIKNIKSYLRLSLKHELGDIDIMTYCNSYQLSQRLDSILPNKPLDTKAKLKI